jgi:hypothetical protein
MRKSVSNFSDKTEIIPNRAWNQAQAIGRPNTTSVGSEWAIGTHQFRNLFLIVEEKTYKDMLKNRVEKSSPDDY